jgi:hypothetical protein
VYPCTIRVTQHYPSTTELPLYRCNTGIYIVPLCTMYPVLLLYAPITLALLCPCTIRIHLYFSTTPVALSLCTLLYHCTTPIPLYPCTTPVALYPVLLLYPCSAVQLSCSTLLNSCTTPVPPYYSCTLVLLLYTDKAPVSLYYSSTHFTTVLHLYPSASLLILYSCTLCITPVHLYLCITPRHL